MTTLSLFVSVVPALLLLHLFRRIDARRPEPLHVVYVTLALGALLCVPAAFVEHLLRARLQHVDGALRHVIGAYGVAAGTEESLKLALVVAVPFRHRAFDEHMDGIVYSAAASLGFGLLENAQYTLRAGASDELVIALERGISAVPAHAIASGVMGYFVGRARFAQGARVLALFAVGWLAAVAIHGTYDLAIFIDDDWEILEVFLVLFTGACMLALCIRAALARDEAADDPRTTVPVDLARSTTPRFRAKS